MIEIIDLHVDLINWKENEILWTEWHLRKDIFKNARCKLRKYSSLHKRIWDYWFEFMTVDLQLFYLVGNTS